MSLCSSGKRGSGTTSAGHGQGPRLAATDGAATGWVRVEVPGAVRTPWRCRQRPPRGGCGSSHRRVNHRAWRGQKLDNLVDNVNMDNYP